MPSSHDIFLADGNDGTNNDNIVFEWNKVGVFKSDTTYDLITHISSYIRS